MDTIELQGSLLVSRKWDRIAKLGIDTPRDIIMLISEQYMFLLKESHG